MEQTNIDVYSSNTVKLNDWHISTYKKSQIFNRAKQMLKFLGPAFIVSVAYVDPAILQPTLAEAQISAIT